MRACDDCGHEGELEKSASGEQHCVDMVACLYRPAVVREVRVACSFCGQVGALVHDGLWRWCADRTACGVRVTGVLHGRKTRKSRKR